jgi:hypothetical protein
MKRKTFEGMACVRQRLCCLGLLLAAGAVPAAHAQELDAQRFTLRGFGTLGATTQNTDGLEFRRTASQARGVAAGDVESYTDSLAGVQFNAALSPKFDVVIQSVISMHSDGDWDPELSQAVVRFSPDESWVLRAGRVSYDIYLLSESRQVGYSYLTLRPSPEVYGLMSNDGIDGADVAFTHRVGRGLARARLFGGRGSSETAFPDGTYADDVDANVYGACFDYLYRGWTARIALVRFTTDANPSFAQIAAGLRMTGVPDAVAIARTLEQPTLTFSGMQLGVAYEDGPLQAQALLGSIDSDSISGPDTYHFYTLFGYRVRALTPYVSFASSRDRESIRSTGLPAIPMFAPLNGAVAGIQSSFRSTQHTTSVGVRYDFSPHVDFKLQVDRVNIQETSLNFDRRSPPGGPGDMTVVAAAIDFVF